MKLFLSQQDGVPVYLQIIQQVKQLITANRLQPDQELPPIRVLAQDLLINPNTVARAYRELEHDGWIYKKRGAGTFVSQRQSPEYTDEAKAKRLEERISALLIEADHLEIDLETVIKLIRKQSQSKKTDDKSKPGSAKGVKS